MVAKVAYNFGNGVLSVGGKLVLIMNVKMISIITCYLPWLYLITFLCSSYRIKGNCVGTHVELLWWLFWCEVSKSCLWESAKKSDARWDGWVRVLKKMLRLPWHSYHINLAVLSCFCLFPADFFLGDNSGVEVSESATCKFSLHRVLLPNSFFGRGKMYIIHFALG